MSINADTLNKRGVELKLRGDDEGARIHHLSALNLDSNFLPALVNMGNMLSGEHRLEAALGCLRRVVACAPDDGHSLLSLGIILMRLERFAEAAQAMDRAAEIMPDVPQVWHNMALLQHRMGNFSTAITLMRQVQLLGHTGPEVENDLAHMLLAEGRDLQRGLEVYESRWWTLVHLPPWDFHIPEWKGERLDGKRILVHSEQGFGDAIMLARFVRDLAQNSGCMEVVFCVPESLRVWFAHQNWPKVRVMAMEDLTAESVADVDFQSPLYSMLRWMEVEWKDIEPENRPLIPPRVECQGVGNGFFNVGICWASGKRYSDSDWRHRHAPLDLWLPLAHNPKIKLWSLTKGEEWEDEIEEIGAAPLVEDHTRMFKDWADTAAVIAKMDLVISVDTAVAHAAAAMGKTTWMLEPYSRCWRWQEIPSGRPWYEIMTIRQQTIPGSWTEPLEWCKWQLDLLVPPPTTKYHLSYSPQVQENVYGHAD